MFNSSHESNRRYEAQQAAMNEAKRQLQARIERCKSQTEIEAVMEAYLSGRYAEYEKILELNEHGKH